MSPAITRGARNPTMRVLTAIPVYNEAAYIEPVLREVLRHAGDVLVVDDGSTDATPSAPAASRGAGDPPPDEPRLRRRPAVRVPTTPSRLATTAS